MKYCAICAMILAGLLLVGCKKKESAPPPTPPAPRERPLATNAQPRLRTIKLWIGPEELVTEMALTPVQMQTGMMFRTNIAENEGMIFVFPYPYRASFWMKNTSVPISAAYIDNDGVILELHDLQPHDTNFVLAATENVRYVIETKQGWFKQKNIAPGTLVRSERGTLQQTFSSK